MKITDPSVQAETELESRAQIDPLDMLHHERRVLMAKLAPLMAMHGPYGMWDERRRALRGAILVRIKTELEGKGVVKLPAADVLEAMACDDPQYKAALDNALAERITYLQLQNDLDDITDKIRNRDLALQAYCAETRLK